MNAVERVEVPAWTFRIFRFMRNVICTGCIFHYNLPEGLENSLNATLDSALASLNDLNTNNDVAAVGKLGSFINKVEAQRGKKITDAQADELITDAQAIIDELLAQINDW